MSEIIASGIVQKRTLQQYIDVFTPLVVEGKIHFGKDGLEIRAVDPANVGMANPGIFHASGFEHYESPGSVTQGVDFDRFEDMIGPADPGDLIELSIDMEIRALRIQFGNVDTSMALIDPDSIRKEPDPPDISLPNEVTLTGSDISRGVTVADMVSDHVAVRACPGEGEVEFFAEGDVDDTVITYGEDERNDGNRLKEAESLFSLEYLEDIAKPIPDDAEVTIQFGTDFPMVLNWESNDGAIDVSQMIAPRIQSD